MSSGFSRSQLGAWIDVGHISTETPQEYAAFDSLPGVSVAEVEATLTEGLSVGVELVEVGRWLQVATSEKDFQCFGCRDSCTQLAGQACGGSGAVLQ